MYKDLDDAILSAERRLSSFGQKVDTGHWQGVSTEGRPDLVTHEVAGHGFSAPVPRGQGALAALVKPNLPWAEDHFAERVSGVPSNPGEQYKNWPYWRDGFSLEHAGPDAAGPDRSYLAALVDASEGPLFALRHAKASVLDELHGRFGCVGKVKNGVWKVEDPRELRWLLGQIVDGVLARREEVESRLLELGSVEPLAEPMFSHTYQERFWPRDLGRGVRYRFGDLDDVVALLRKHPFTRQAYLPVFFPEDTGAVHGGRVPCSIGYGFLRRDRLFHCFYTLRSCDIVRYLRDDVYLAARLLQHVRERLRWEVDLALHVSVWSLHIFEADLRLGRKA